MVVIIFSWSYSSSENGWLLIKPINLSIVVSSMGQFRAHLSSTFIHRCLSAFICWWYSDLCQHHSWHCWPCYLKVAGLFDCPLTIDDLISKHLNMPTSKTIAHAVCSRLNHCNSLFYNICGIQIKRLQNSQTHFVQWLLILHISHQSQDYKSITISSYEIQNTFWDQIGHI